MAKIVVLINEILLINTGLLLPSEKKGWKEKLGIYFKEMMGDQAKVRPRQESPPCTMFPRK